MDQPILMIPVTAPVTEEVPSTSTPEMPVSLPDMPSSVHAGSGTEGTNMAGTPVTDPQLEPTPESYLNVGSVVDRINNFKFPDPTHMFG